MALIIPQNGCESYIAYLISKMNVSGEVKVHLFKNNLTPDFDTVLGDFTEADFTGYAAIAVSDWGQGADIGGARVELISAADKVFTCSGAGGLPMNIYGYWIESTANGLLHCERVTGAPLVVTNSGQTLKIKPKIEFGNC